MNKKRFTFTVGSYRNWMTEISPTHYACTLEGREPVESSAVWSKEDTERNIKNGVWTVVEAIPLPQKFNFYSILNSSRIYTATRNEDKFIISWDDMSTPYPAEVVKENIECKYWVILDNIDILVKELADAEENYRNVMDVAIKRVVDAKAALRIAKGE